METNTPVVAYDMTGLGKKEEKVNSILPPALRAAKALNKKNTIGIKEVTLPVMNVKVKCKAFSNIDDLTAKTISGSMTAYNDANMRLLFNHLEFPFEITLDRFLYSCTEADFRTALYGVMCSSFKKLEENTFQCKNKNCPNPHEHNIWTEQIDMMNINIIIPQAPFISPNNDHTKDLFVAQSGILTINYKFDSLQYKMDLFNSKSNDEIRHNLSTIGMMVPKADLQMNYIDSIIVVDPENPEEQFIIKEENDIKLFINQLDVTSRDEIESLNARYIDHIDGWIPTFETTVKCPHCETSQKWEDIDIYIEFFRKFTAIF